jgi:hypothetical protein
MNESLFGKRFAMSNVYVYYTKILSGNRHKEFERGYKKLMDIG